MKKKIIAGLALMVIALYTLLFLFATPERVYETNMEMDIIVQGGVTQTEPLVRNFEIPKDGEYTLDAGGIIDSEGLTSSESKQVACFIRDENGEEISSFSVESFHVMSEEMFLEAGEYTITLAPITSVEQWREYFIGSYWGESVKEPESDTVFVTDGEFSFRLNFIVDTQKDIQDFIIVLSLALCIILFVIMLAITQKAEGLKQNYNEF